MARQQAAAQTAKDGNDKIMVNLHNENWKDAKATQPFPINLANSMIKRSNKLRHKKLKGWVLMDDKFEIVNGNISAKQ